MRKSPAFTVVARARPHDRQSRYARHFRIAGHRTGVVAAVGAMLAAHAVSVTRLASPMVPRIPAGGTGRLRVLALWTPGRDRSILCDAGNRWISSAVVRNRSQRLSRYARGAGMGGPRRRGLCGGARGGNRMEHDHV